MQSRICPCCNLPGRQDTQLYEMRLELDRATQRIITAEAAAEARQASEAALRSELQTVRAALERQTALPPRRIRRRSAESHDRGAGFTQARPATYALLADLDKLPR